jgi:hypothetical protein
MEFELRGKDMVARRETMQRLIRERQDTLQLKNAQIFERLLTTRQMANVFFKEEDSRENILATDFFRVDLSFNQVINKVRYSSVIYEFHKLFMSVGAKYDSYPLKDLPARLPAYTVVLVDINDICRAYTFEEITFEGFAGLYDKFYTLNYRTEIVLNFIHVDKNSAGAVSKTRKVSSITVPINSTFFTDITNRALSSFVISTKVTRPEFYHKITFDTDELREINLFTGEYPAATIEKNAQYISESEKESRQQQSKAAFFDSFNAMFDNKHNTFFISVEVLYIPDEIEDATGIGDTIGLSFEYEHFFSSLPILGLALKGAYGGDYDNSSDYTYVNKWDIDYGRVDLLGIARLPIHPIGVNLRAFAGVGYSDFTIKDVKAGKSYSTNGISTTYGLGIEKYFDMFNLGFRYKFVLLPNSARADTATANEPLNGFEIYIGVVW